MIRAMTPTGLAEWAQNWSGLYVLPPRLDVTTLPAPIRCASDVLVCDMDGGGCVRASISDVAVMRAMSPSAVGRLFVGAMETALGIGWDADGREVPT